MDDVINGNERIKTEQKQKFGTSFNYTFYFARRRDRFFKQKVNQARDFIERLDFAIQISIRMTGTGDHHFVCDESIELFTENDACRTTNNVTFAIWSSGLIPNVTQLISMLVRKLKAEEGNKFAKDGYYFEWRRELTNSAEQVSENERRSGPLILCADCFDMMKWYEIQVHLKKVLWSLKNRELADLPPLVEIYSRLISSLKLCQFFAKEYTNLLLQADEHQMRIAEIKRCISSCCTDISGIGFEIERLSSTKSDQERLLFYRRREFLLHQNISQFCAYIVADANLLLSFDPKHANEIVIEVEPNGIWDEICRVFCRPIRLRAFWHKTESTVV
ncbi:hypothetical protein M3Y98_00207500 [Aphelenchoides besseyi]|nr:hypothetical protein M3Y98_00207500 [Aphelenchoides besseyi]